MQSRRYPALIGVACLCVFAHAKGTAAEGGKSSAGASSTKSSKSEALCDDSCLYSRDGECDDSGPSSSGTSCKLGTDCTDCGPRKEENLGDFMCTNQCHLKKDGECDDGGLGSKSAKCAFGTDCHDCGPRISGAQCQSNHVQLCGSGCAYAENGICDDGGPGAKYESCSLGSDCEDCGPREVPCSKSATGGSYSYDQPTVAEPPPSPPPPSACIGEGGKPGIPSCQFGACSWNRPTDCKRCHCALCDFCTKPKGDTGHPAGHSPPPPPPVPLPPFVFTCDLLDGRENTLLHQPQQYCYQLSPSECQRSFVYSEAPGGKDASLSICHIVGENCEPVHVPADEFSARDCKAKLRMPPSPPPLPSPPPSPPSPPGEPRAPPPPHPCVPLSAKCGGVGWTGETACCNPEHVSCYKKNDHYSQCRASCNVAGWDCYATPEPSLKATSSPPPPSRMRSPPPPPPPSPSPPSTEEDVEDDGEDGMENDEHSTASAKGKGGHADKSHNKGKDEKSNTAKDQDNDDGDEGDAADDKHKGHKESHGTVGSSLAAFLSDTPSFELYAIGILLLLGGAFLGGLCSFLCSSWAKRKRTAATQFEDVKYNNNVRTTDDVDHRIQVQAEGRAERNIRM